MNALRDRIAEIIYGNGHYEWTTALDLADLIVWEMNYLLP